MHPRKCYEICHRYYGKVVRIEARDGYTHFGKIVQVTDESVWIEPIHRKRFDYGFGYYDAGYDHDNEHGCHFCGGLRSCDHCGFGYGGGYGGYGGYSDGYGYGYGGAYALEFGFIFGIALAALFFI
ncbi:hypothetical protein [Bacillus manliponensis]|uniref:hypothetical protein n=1 Tax=Bacillus manliponensis TaxID=574376 RepID=UPI0035140190